MEPLWLMLKPLILFKTLRARFRKPSSFLISGLIANFVNYIFYEFFVYATVSIFVSAIIGYSAGLFVSFFLNQNWVFKAEDESGFFLSSSVQTSVFLIVHALAAVSMGGLTSSLVKIMGLGTSVSFVVAAVPIALLNYLALNFLVFRMKKLNSEVS